MKVLSNVAQSGLDNHRKFGNLTARDAQKNVVTRMTLDYTNHQAMARQLSQLPPGTPVIVESSFGWGWVCDELAQRGLSPYLASASKVSAFRKLKNNAKSNRIDSNALSELPLNEDWWRVWLAPPEVRDQRELLQYRMGLVECQTQTKLRIHALLHRHGIIHPFSDLFGVGGRKFLKLLAESDTLRDTGRGKLKVTRTFTWQNLSRILPSMPRLARKTPGGLVYHVLNRANGRLRLFKKDDDFLAFERVLLVAHQRVPIRILDWCLMPNHWHFVLWPEKDGELTAFMRWMTLTHAQRWKHAHAAVGHGHLYQGRFKSFPIEQDEHLLTVLRYVERNPVRAKLARRAEQWRWGSCGVRGGASKELRALLSDWPVGRPRNWLDLVNRPQAAAEEEAVKEHLQRNRPLGGEQWVQQTARSLNLEQTLRPRGRPPGWRKHSDLTGNRYNGSRHL